MVLHGLAKAKTQVRFLCTAQDHIQPLTVVSCLCIFIYKTNMGLTNMKGDLAELKVAAKFLEKGWYVSYPFGDDTPYDLIVDVDGSLMKVQVKHIIERNKTLTVKLVSNTGVTYKEKVDLIAIYEPKNEEVYLIDPKKFESDTIVTLRLEKSKNNQTKGIIMAENYKI